MTDLAEITRLLEEWAGEHDDVAGSEERLLEEVYSEMRRLARVFLRSERRGHSFSPSDLIHETYLRLRGRRRIDWSNRRHFFAVACQCMRRILIEHARRLARPKHGAGLRAETLEEGLSISRERAPEIIALHEALEALAGFDPFKASLVELRFFGGFSIPETAKLLGCSHATIERHWRLARAWLFAEVHPREVGRAPREAAPKG